MLRRTADGRSASGRTTRWPGRAYAGGVSAVYAWLSRHPKLVDGVPAAFLLLLGLATVQGSVNGRPANAPGPVSAASTLGPRPALLLLLLITVAMAVPVVFRRKYPVGAFAGVIAEHDTVHLAADADRRDF